MLWGAGQAVTPTHPKFYWTFALNRWLLTFKSLSEAVNDLKSTFQGKLSFGDNQVVLFAKECPALWMAKNDPLQSNIFEVFGTDFSSICSMSIVGSILSCNLIRKLVARVECQDLRNMKWNRGDDNVYMIWWVPTFSGLYLRLLMVFLTKSTASLWVLFDFQLPAIIRLLREKA